MKSFFIIRPYWMGKGRSRPKSWLTAASVAGSALRPAMRAAGSTPGVAKKIAYVRTLIANITKTIETSRRTMNANIGAYALLRSFARGSSASRSPSPKTFRVSTTSTIAMPGLIATHGRV